MPVGNITASNLLQQTSMRQPATTKNSIAQNNTASTTAKTTEHNKSKLPYVAAGVAIAAIAGACVFKSKFSFKNEAILKKISEVKSRCAEEFERILNSPENSAFGEIKLNNMDKAAEFRALDKTRPDYLHEAANMAEEAYKKAYQRSKPEEGKNILDKIFFRIDKESKTLPNIYAQMPKEEACTRINVFAKSAREMDDKAGMSVEEFTRRIIKFMESAPKTV